MRPGLAGTAGGRWEGAGSHAVRVVSVGMEVRAGVYIPDFRTSHMLRALWVKEVWYRKSSFIKLKSGGHSSLFETVPHGNPQHWPSDSRASGIKCPFPPLETSANWVFRKVPAASGRVMRACSGLGFVPLGPWAGSCAPAGHRAGRTGTQPQTRVLLSPRPACVAHSLTCFFLPPDVD